MVHAPVGKISFAPEKLVENATVVLTSVIKAKPAVARGKHLEGVTLELDDGSGILIDTTAVETAAKA